MGIRLIDKLKRLDDQIISLTFQDNPMDSTTYPFCKIIYVYDDAVEFESYNEEKDYISKNILPIAMLKRINYDSVVIKKMELESVFKKEVTVEE